MITETEPVLRTASGEEFAHGSEQKQLVEQKERVAG